MIYKDAYFVPAPEYAVLKAKEALAEEYYKHLQTIRAKPWYRFASWVEQWFQKADAVFAPKVELPIWPEGWEVL